MSFDSGKLTLNANVAGAKTPAVSCLGSGSITMFVVPGPGNHANHEIELQVGPNAAQFLTCETLQGVGIKRCFVDADSVRAKIKTAEGVPSSVDIYFIGT